MLQGLLKNTRKTLEKHSKTLAVVESHEQYDQAKMRRWSFRWRGLVFQEVKDAEIELKYLRPK